MVSDLTDSSTLLLKRINLRLFLNSFTFHLSQYSVHIVFILRSVLIGPFLCCHVYSKLVHFNVICHRICAPPPGNHHLQRHNIQDINKIKRHKWEQVEIWVVMYSREERVNHRVVIFQFQARRKGLAWQPNVGGLKSLYSYTRRTFTEKSAKPGMYQWQMDQYLHTSRKASQQKKIHDQIYIQA